MQIANPSATKDILERFGFSFKKRFGQNFLIDENVVRKIVRLAGVSKSDGVLEIGPGIGTMTAVLADEAKNVLAVEIDKSLMDVLAYTLEEYNNVNVLNQDILRCDLEDLRDTYNDGKPFKVVANLPYYITTPIIMQLLETNAKKDKPLLESITVMVQKEVALRMQASPGTKDYGALSLAIEYYTEPELVMNVPASVFMPKPNVDSAVIRLSLRKEKIKVNDEAALFSLIRAAFANRRKTFINSVSGSGEYNKEELRAALKKTGFDENIRGEALSLQDYIALSDLLKKHS